MTFYPSLAWDMIESRHAELLREAETERLIPPRPARRPRTSGGRRAQAQSLAQLFQALTSGAWVARPQGASPRRAR